MSKLNLRVAILIAIVPLALAPFFQNCSRPEKFKAIVAKSSASMGGGEGYGGKLYGIVSPSQQCSDPSIPPSALKAMSQAEVYLISNDCQSLVNPQLVNATFDVNPDIAYFNGRTFREENSTAPFTPVVNETVLDINIENMTFLPPNSNLNASGFYVFNSDGEAAEDVVFNTSGTHRFTIRGKDWLLNMTGDAQMELRIDGVSIGIVSVSRLVSEYTFVTNVTAGTHRVGIWYINDQNTDGDPDRDLNLDWLRITR
jgi:hypothetical protein